MPQSTPTPPPLPEELTLYADQGGLAYNDPNTLIFSEVASDEYEGGAAEGNRYAGASIRPGKSIGITFDRNFQNLGRDLTAFASGRMHFFVRIDHAFGPDEKLTVSVEDNKGGKGSVTLSGADGFSGAAAGRWQEIFIPLGSFAGINFTGIRIPFELRDDSPMDSSPYKMDFDFVQWLR